MDYYGRNNEHEDDSVEPLCDFHIGSIVVEACGGQAIGVIPWSEELSSGAILIKFVYVCRDHLDMIGDTLSSLEVWGVTSE